MNNLLSHKNEEAIKQSAADFYTLTIYSKDILNLDYLRLNHFMKYRNKEKGKEFGIQSLYKNKFKLFASISVSLFLMFKFKSILIIPLFFTSYLVTKKVIDFEYFKKNRNNSNKSMCECYFCKSNELKKYKLKEYEKYFEMINYLFELNPNISSIKEFEVELDKVLNDKKKILMKD